MFANHNNWKIIRVVPDLKEKDEKDKEIYASVETQLETSVLGDVSSGNFGAYQTKDEKTDGY